ncbi:hypothetical protein ABT364_19750 [Massilia sp. SR12]
MFNSKFGAFDGPSWEALCQQVFKRKYLLDDYQPFPASPGDYGLEGATLRTGWGFQCYCPSKHYARPELYEKQRDKITEDLGKLRTYQGQIQKLLGSTKLTRWIFVTPEFDRHALIAHARTKEVEVRAWGLPFIEDDFTVLLFDGDQYLIEINEIRSASGQCIVFDEAAPELAKLVGDPEEYEGNVLRKSRKRLAHKKSVENFDERVQRLHQRTLEEFLEADGLFRRIESASPLVFLRLVRLINEFENFVVSTADTWEDTPEALTVKIRDTLEQRIVADLSPEFDQTHASSVARHMVARWLAICELDYD